MRIFGWDYPPGCSGPPEPEDDILGLPPDEWTDSAENEPEVETDKFEQRDTAVLVKPRGKCVVEVAHDGVKWDV